MKLVFLQTTARTSDEVLINKTLTLKVSTFEYQIFVLNGCVDKTAGKNVKLLLKNLVLHIINEGLIRLKLAQRKLLTDIFLNLRSNNYSIKHFLLKFKTIRFLFS